MNIGESITQKIPTQTIAIWKDVCAAVGMNISWITNISIQGVNAITTHQILSLIESFFILTSGLEEEC